MLPFTHCCPKPWGHSDSGPFLSSLADSFPEDFPTHKPLHMLFHNLEWPGLREVNKSTRAP
jgi:hypothetical protein